MRRCIAPFAHKAVRYIHASSSSHYPRSVGRSVLDTFSEPAPPELRKTGLLLDEGPDVEADSVEDVPAGAHIFLGQQREILTFMRLIEHDIPNLVRWRKPFIPLSKATPLVVRTIDYGGEPHPATAKRVIVAPVAKLPLKTPEAVENFKLLAGTRWSPSPPRDSGISIEEDNGEHGFVKISCGDFPVPGMNLKWASDVLERLVVEAHVLNPKFASITPDTRHVYAKARKEHKEDYFDGRSGGRPSIRDFPKTWLEHVQPHRTTNIEVG
ncbi:hypothetical protein BD410DRAFT_227049 [Rickenella mellea]|uniref:Small ribosomal subunit protein mS35 mitochondrial conserved domain-containing protein n=1 Tax=Rickenella mellea TaxID=50990 RepID=A0A4Y7QNT5_9AGAM|nr:hypothetical protein BD410DRAFT_227049 [Rickenella mellea]